MASARNTTLTDEDINRAKAQHAIWSRQDKFITETVLDPIIMKIDIGISRAREAKAYEAYMYLVELRKELTEGLPKFYEHNARIAGR